MTRIGIVGCGKIARVHATALRKLVRGSELVFCDRNRERAEGLAAAHGGGRAYEDVDELLSQESLDALHVLTQPGSHVEISEKALRAGTHVYVEKPVTERASDYQRLLDVARTNDRVLYAGYSTLGMPHVRRIRDLLRSGEFGSLVTVHCDFNSSPRQGIPYGRPDHWAYSLTGGVLQNIADHPSSLVVDAVGEITEHRVLMSRRSQLPNGCADLLHVAIRNDRAIGSFTISFGNGNPEAQAVYSLEGATIHFDLRRQLLSVIVGRGPQRFPSRVVSGLRLGWGYAGGTIAAAAGALTGSLEKDPGIRGLVRNFYEVIEGRAEPIVSEDTVRRMLDLHEHVWDVAQQTAPAHQPA